MIPDSLFIIKELACAYKRGNIILRIHDLTIPRNQLVVLIGKSGSGKSTFLETLGLMNNTIDSGDVHFYSNDKADPISYKRLWENANSYERAQIRRGYFSFIFQNTNLMPNFTAYENACLTQMIQGKSFSTSRENVREVMSTMGLGNVPEWKNASELSGGQKQRLAFVRAITPDFTVLFGDEPTGNLDESNSDELMALLKTNLTKNKRSAIIVSHNINLSLQYADVLILLKNTATDKGDCIELNQSCVYTKVPDTNKWCYNNGREVNDIINEIKSIF
jgi:ABC-type lipoprotein export system ATPase subunit